MHCGVAAEDKAAEWYARLCADDCTAADRLSFRAWLEADPAHRAAWDRVEWAGVRLDGCAADPQMRELVQQALNRSGSASGAPGVSRWQSYRMLAMAAAVTLVVGLGAALAVHGNPADAPVAARTLAITHDQPRSIHLEDGSEVRLAAASRLSVRTGSGGRTLTLEAGRAGFSVARDPQHPFTVTAAGHVVTALGTEFAVDLSKDRRATVALHEGSVEVRRLDDGRVWRLQPGTVLDLHDGVVASSTQPAMLTFDQMPLTEVVAQLNPQLQAPLVLDPALADQPFSGSLQADGGEALIEALEAYGIARARPGDRGTILLVPY